MVKIVTPAGGRGGEVVTIGDLLGPKTPPGPAGALQTATDAVQQMDKWISLADRGISMLGRVDSILGRVQTLRGPAGEQQQQGPPKTQYIGPPPADMPVNVERQQLPPGDPAAGPVQGPAPVDIKQIIGALDMIAKMNPEITVEQLAASMAARPEECQRILDAAMSGKIPGVGNVPPA